MKTFVTLCAFVTLFIIISPAIADTSEESQTTENILLAITEVPQVTATKSGWTPQDKIGYIHFKEVLIGGESQSHMLVFFMRLGLLKYKNKSHPYGVTRITFEDEEIGMIFWVPNDKFRRFALKVGDTWHLAGSLFNDGSAQAGQADIRLDSVYFSTDKSYVVANLCLATKDGDVCHKLSFPLH